MFDSTGWDYAVCALIGGGVGLVELVSRYRDEPWQACRSGPGALYLLLNGLASVLALFLLRTSALGFDVAEQAADGADSQQRVAEVLVAGLGAAVVMRASVFRFHHDDRAVPIGPAAVLDVLLLAVDRAVDRRRAIDRDALVRELAPGLDFDKAYDELPAYCLGLMQNVSAEEQRRLGEQVASISAGSDSNDAKVRLLVLALLNIVGEEVLRRGIASLGEQIRVAG